MRKFLLALGVLLLLVLSIPTALLLTGTIDRTSLSMMLNVMLGTSGPQADATTVAQRYQLPPGFSISLYASDVPKARFLHVTPAGDLLVSRPHSGDILLLRRDADGDGLPDGRETLLQDLRRPLGVDSRDGWLYVAESNRVGRVPFDSTRGELTGDYETLVDGLTDNGNHWSKTIRIGQDNKLYLAQGSTCNVCAEEDARRATMMRFNLDGSGAEVLATGLRNSVGFDWAPWSGALYATDNGRDLLGDDFPPCELNHIETGKFYGWPYYHGDNVPDPDMGSDPQQRPPTAPVHAFRAHNAPLGIRFINPAGLPAEFNRSALVALHGSWNRSEPDGYKVVSLHWTRNGIEERDFLSGFNRDGDISGRPVDVAQGQDGTLYISDDYAGAIYRVRYGELAPGAAIALPARQSQLDRHPPSWLQGADLPALAARGAQHYARYRCANCHERGTNPKYLDNLQQRLGYSAVIEALRNPQSPMPVYPLDERALRELAVYLLHPELRAPMNSGY